MNTQPFLLLVLIILIPRTSFAQNTQGSTSGIAFTIYKNKTSAFDIKRDYLMDAHKAGISSLPSFGYEGQLSYFWSITPKLKSSIGITGGVQSYEFSVFGYFEFLGFATKDATLLGVKEYNLPYIGLMAGSQYSIALGKKSSLEINGSLSGLYFFPERISIAGFDEGHLVFDVNLQVNPSPKIILAPILGISYVYDLNERFSFNIGLSGSYPGKKIIETVGQYRIIGDSENLTGKLTKHFRQIGLGVGVAYHL